MGRIDLVHHHAHRGSGNDGGALVQSNHDAEPLSLERLFAILRRRWWVIVLTTVLVGAATLVFSERQRKQYTATTSVLLFTDVQINPQSSLPVSSASVDVSPSAQATAVQLLSNQPGVTLATARLVGHGVTASEISGAVNVSQQGQTNIADISVTNPDPSLAAKIANTYVTQYIASQQGQERATLQRGLNEVSLQLAGLSSQQRAGPQGQSLLDQQQSMRILLKASNGGVQQLRPAQTPTSPSSPKISRNTALGVLLGLLIGLGLAFLLERLDRRIKNVDEVGPAFRLPLLGVIPRDSQYALAPNADGSEHRAHLEVFRLLRAYLRYFNVDRELRALMVASGSPGDGKTTVARNLAEAAQETGTKTLLLEADLRRPCLANHYGLDPAPGLSEVLACTATVAEAARSVPIATRVNGSTSEVVLDVLVGGHTPPNPAELLQSHAMADVLSWATEHYELVVVDTPPLAVVSDAMPLLKGVDGVVLVSQIGKNTRDSAAFLRERLEGVNAPVLGVVANGVRATGRRGYGYGYGYGYYAADGAAPSPVAPSPSDAA
jgi:receptor protein-tyrosine kinase